MAGDRQSKTEKPTARRKREARKKGQIARSHELVSWTLVLVGISLLPGFVGNARKVGEQAWGNVSEVAAEPSPARMASLASATFQAMLNLVIPLLLGLAVVAIVVNVAQVGFVLSSKSLKPSFRRLNPLAGLKRLVSTRSLWETVKALVKLAVFAAVAYPLVRGMVDDLLGGSDVSFWALVSLLGDRSRQLVRDIAATGLVIAAADYGYQRISTNRQLMMTKQELKEEMRNQEGNPEIKGRIKSKQLALSRNRMLAQVAKADVVVVNPIHIAVALVYEPARGAPRVLAKGQGWVAERIREEAEKHDVPIIESIPLARALHASCELDREIPIELYEGVARLLAFVHRLGARRRPIGGGYLRLPETMAMALA